MSTLPENHNDSKPTEQVELNFFGIKFKSNSPTSKTIIILVIWLLFIIILVLLLPKMAIVKWFSVIFPKAIILIFKALIKL